MASPLEGKPLWIGALIGIFVAGGLLAATQFLLINDINKDSKTQDKKLDELAKKIEAGKAAEKKLPQFREEVKRLELELEKLKRILPSSRNTEEIIKKIKALVDQGNFTLEKLVFPPLSPPGGEEIYAEWPISVTVQGRYHDLAILFNRLSNFQRIINIEQFTVTALRDQSDRTVGTNFIAKTFVYVEPKEDLASDGKKGGKPGGKKKKKASDE
ncbi:MAG TPA: type 4a pilus biogenesis protein PilO [Thermoanaerobaculia bacterium]